MKISEEEKAILINLLEHEIDFLINSDELKEAKKLAKLIKKIKEAK